MQSEVQNGAVGSSCTGVVKIYWSGSGEVHALKGIDAVMHMAALSNDPLGDLDSKTTYDINLHASVRLAEAAKQAGVKRFLFSSSCSLYGAGGDGFLDENAAFNLKRVGPGTGR